MPVILPEEYHEAWLSGEAGKEILVPFPADRMKAWPISPRVNSPMNNDPEIIGSIEGTILTSDPCAEDNDELTMGENRRRLRASQNPYSTTIFGNLRRRSRNLRTLETAGIYRPLRM